MATPRAGDNRVAPTQMDGRHVHNKHPARCTFTFVKRLQHCGDGWGAGKRAVIWQRNLLLGLLGSGLEGLEGSKAYLHQPDLDQDHGRLARW